MTHHPAHDVRRRAWLTGASAAAAAAAVAWPRIGRAQAWPRRSVSILVPYSAGGSLDLTARLVAQALGERLGQNVVVENVTGAGGSVGIQKVIKSAPDGYSLLAAGDAPLNPSPTAGQSAYRHDMRVELAPIGLINTAPMVLVAHPDFAAADFDQLLASARANPGRFNYATSGVGTILHLTMEMIKQQGRLAIVHIPYRGGALIMNDVAGRQIEMAMVINASALPFLRAKTVKALAVTSAKRLPWLPDVPAVAESAGFKGFDVVSWAGLYAPAGTPDEVVLRLNRELDAVLRLPAVRTRLTDLGAVPGGGTPADFARYIADDRARFARVLKTVPLGG